MIHERGYWLSTDNTAYCCDKSLADALVEMFGDCTVVDIGCGNGDYVKHFLNNKILCVGYDGNPDTPKITHGLCGVKDFSEPVDIGKFDLVLSLEVGEHIPVEYEQTFLDNICRASKKYICLSWATPGQEGIGHVNCRDNCYIIKEMRARVVEMNIEMTKAIRKASTLPWGKNTIMIFEKDKEINEYKNF